jgi:hypothetical protein
MKRRTHFAAERLSAEALAIIHRGLRDKLTFAAICAAVAKTTGECMAKSSLARYAASHEVMRRELQRTQEEAAAVIAEVKAGNTSAHEMATALVSRALFQQREALQSADPVDLSREERERRKLELKAVELELKRRDTEIREREMTMLEKKLVAAEQREQKIRERAEAAKQAVNRAGESIAPELRKQLLDVYDLTEAEA